jgi:hypothetical protein
MRFNWPAVAVVVVVIALLAVIVIAVVSPSCADRGGKEVFSHFQPIIHSSGKTTWIQNVPIYDCVGVE